MPAGTLTFLHQVKPLILDRGEGVKAQRQTIRYRTPSRRTIDLTGRRFGKLLVLEYERTDGHGQRHWRCKCDCGRETVVRSNNLLSGLTKGCGGTGNGCVRRVVER